jgi:chromosome segregation ATPase
MYSSGSAAKENSAYMESLQAKITNLKATYENIVLGDGGISDFAKKLLDSANSILKFIDYGNNLQAMLSGVLGILITIKSQNIATTILSTYSSVVKLGQGIKALTTGNVLVNVFNAARNAINTYRASIIAGTTATQAASAAMNTLKLSMSGIAAGVGIAITAISLITQAVNSYKQKQEEAAEETRQQLKDYSSTSEQYANLRESLTKTTLTQEEFNSILKAAPDIFGDYRGEVKLTKESLDEYIKKLDEASSKQARTTFISSLSESKDAAERLSKPREYAEVGSLSELSRASVLPGAAEGGILRYGGEFQNAKTVEEALSSLEKMQDAIARVTQSTKMDEDTREKYNDLLGITSKLYKDISEGSENDIATLRGQIDAYNDANGSLSSYSKEVENYKNILGDTEPTQENTVSTTEQMAAALGMSTEKFTSQAKAMGMTEEEFYNYAHGIKEAGDATTDAEQATKSYSDILTNLASEMNVAQKAYTEYTKSGQISIDSLNSLLSLQPEYLQHLMDEQGQLDINKQSLEDLSQAMKDNAANQIVNQAASDMLALSIGNIDGMSSYAKAALAATGKVALDTGSNAISAADDVDTLTNAMYNMYTTMGGKQVVDKDLKKQQDIIVKGAIDRVKTLQKTQLIASKALNTNTSSTHRNTSATNKNTDAKEKNRQKNKELSKEIDNQTKKLEKQKDKIKDNIDAWNDQAEEMEKLFSIVIDRIEEKIDKLQEKNDKYQEKIDARTEKFEKAKEKEEKALDKKIDAIDKEIAAQQEANDAVDDAIELQEKLENLRKAQSTKVKVFKDGQWTWGTDQAAVDEAQKELDEYNRAKAQENAIAELERAKELLETQKDSLDAKYEALIANDKLINKWQSIIDKNNEEIALLEKQKKEVEDISKMYERMEENAILKKYLDTDKIFGTKGLKHSVIPTLQKVENEYINIQDYIKDAEEEVKRFEKAISGLNDLSSQVGNSEGSISGGWVQRQIDKWLNKINPKRKSKKKKKKKKHASGVANIANDEIALVGESPYEEMIIGSKYNTGTVAQLSKGSGVVNAAATNTLAGILNTFAKSNFGAGNGVLNNNSRDLSTIINISNLNVETQNGEQFVNYLQDFAMKMRQESYKNK